MTRNDTIRMALEAGIPAAKYPSLVSDSDWQALERFFHAAYAAGVNAEREACAQVCDDRDMGDCNREDMEARACAAAIRARGQA